MNSSPDRPKRTRKQVDYTAGAILADDDDFAFASLATNKGKNVVSQSSDDFQQHDQPRPDTSGKRSSQDDENNAAKKRRMLSLDKSRRTERRLNVRERKEQEDLRIALELSMTDVAYSPASATPIISQPLQWDQPPISNVVVAKIDGGSLLNPERYEEQRELVDGKESMGGEEQGVDVERIDESGEVDSGTLRGEVEQSANKSEASSSAKSSEPDTFDAPAFSNTPEGELDGVNVVEVETCKSRTTAAPSPSSVAESAKAMSQATTAPQSEVERGSNDDRDDLKVPIGPLSADNDSDSDFVETKRGRKATKAKPRVTKTKVVGKRGPKERKMVGVEDETNNGEEAAVKTEGGDVMAPQKEDRKMVMVDVEIVLKQGKRGRPRQVDLSENVTRGKGERENDGERPCVQEEETGRRPLVDMATKTSRGVGKKENKLAVDENDDDEFDGVGKIFSEDEDDESDSNKGEAKRKGNKKALRVSSKLAIATVKQPVTSNTATTAATSTRLKTKAKSDNLIGVSNGGDVGATKIDIVARAASLGVGKTVGNDGIATAHVASSTVFGIGHLITNPAPIRVGLSRRNKKLTPLHPYLGRH